MVTASWKAVAVRAMQGSVCEMEWDVATVWQLRGLCGNYRVYVAVTQSRWRLLEGVHVHPVIAT